MSFKEDFRIKRQRYAMFFLGEDVKSNSCTNKINTGSLGGDVENM